MNGLRPFWMRRRRWSGRRSAPRCLLVSGAGGAWSVGVGRPSWPGCGVLWGAGRLCPGLGAARGHAGRCHLSEPLAAGVGVSRARRRIWPCVGSAGARQVVVRTRCRRCRQAQRQAQRCLRGGLTCRPLGCERAQPVSRGERRGGGVGGRGARGKRRVWGVRCWDVQVPPGREGTLTARR